MVLVEGGEEAEVQVEGEEGGEEPELSVIRTDRVRHCQKC